MKAVTSTTSRKERRPRGLPIRPLWQKAARRLASVPGFTEMMLFWRRLGGRHPGVRRIVATPKGLRKTLGSGGVAMQSAPGQRQPQVWHLREVRVLAQPAAILSGRGDLFWPLAPQLQRTPRTSAALWKYPVNPRRLRGLAGYAAVDGFSYYHWLLGTLPKLLALRTHAGGFALFEHLLVNPRHKSRGGNAFQEETLSILQVPSSRVVWLERGSELELAELVAPDEPCAKHQTVLLSWAQDLLRAEFLPMAAKAKFSRSKWPERIFVSRKHARRRRLLNEEEISAALLVNGFSLVHTENVPFLEQVELFRRAKVVVGLHGAGLSNLVFASPGTKVVEIVPDRWRNPCFANLARLVEGIYAEIAAKSTDGKHGFQADAIVERAAVLQALAKMGI